MDLDGLDADAEDMSDFSGGICHSPGTGKSQKIPAKDAIFRDLALEDRAWVPVGAARKPDAVFAPVASQLIDVLAQSCANGNGKGPAAGIARLNLTVDFTNKRRIKPCARPASLLSIEQWQARSGAAHRPPRTTKLWDRRQDETSFDEIERSFRIAKLAILSV
jgi:hypothetical protein